MGGLQSETIMRIDQTEVFTGLDCGNGLTVFTRAPIRVTNSTLEVLQPARNEVRSADGRETCSIELTAGIVNYRFEGVCLVGTDSTGASTRMAPRRY